MVERLPFGYWYDLAWQEEQRKRFRARFRFVTDGQKVSWVRDGGWIPAPAHGNWFDTTDEAEREIGREVGLMLDTEIRAHRIAESLEGSTRNIAMTWWRRLGIWWERRRLNQPYDGFGW